MSEQNSGRSKPVSTEPSQRRDFLKAGALGAVALGVASLAVGSPTATAASLPIAKAGIVTALENRANEEIITLIGPMKRSKVEPQLQEMADYLDQDAGVSSFADVGAVVRYFEAYQWQHKTGATAIKPSLA